MIKWSDQRRYYDLNIIMKKAMKKAHAKALETFWLMFRHFRNVVSNWQRLTDYYTGMILKIKNAPKLMWKYLKELMPGNSKPSAKSLLVAGKIVTNVWIVTSAPLVLS